MWGRAACAEGPPSAKRCVCFYVLPTFYPRLYFSSTQLRPMNCPFHIAIYKNGYYSYRDLPLRWAELGTVYRYERSGTMHGLFRVRGFTQVRPDVGHLLASPSLLLSTVL